MGAPVLKEPTYVAMFVLCFPSSNEFVEVCNDGGRSEQQQYFSCWSNVEFLNNSTGSRRMVSKKYLYFDQFI